MKNGYRFLAAALVTLLMGAVLAVGIYAHTFTDVYEFDEAIETLSSVKVIEGYSDTVFSPNSNVTRWQMALLITKMVTGNVDASYWYQSNANMTFEDIQNHHYMNSIAYAAANGIIKGTSAQTFAPEEGITYQDGLTMAARALKYPSATYDPGYPNSYITLGESIGLTSGLERLSPTDTLTRGQTAQLLYNAFNANQYSGTETLAESVFGFTDTTVVLTATENMRINARVSFAKNGKLVFNELFADGTFGRTYAIDETEFDFENPDEHIGQSYRVKALDNFKTIVSMEPCKSEVYTHKTEPITVAGYGTNAYLNIKNTAYSPVTSYSYSLEEGVTPRSKEIIVYGVSDLFNIGDVLLASDISGTSAYYTMTVFDDNDDGYFDRAVYKPYSFGKYSLSGTTITLEGRRNYSMSTRDIVFSNETPRDGDYVLYNLNQNTNTLDVCETFTLQSGTLSAYNTTSATIGNQTYAIGNAELYGAYPDSLQTTLENVQLTGSGTGLGTYFNSASVRYIADDGHLLYIEIVETTTGTTTTQGYVSNYDCAVVEAVSTTTSTSYIAVKFRGWADAWIYVSSIDGMAPSTINTLKVGDIVEYTISSTMVGTTFTTIYSVTKINAKPFYTVTSANHSIKYVDLNQLALVERVNNTDRVIAYIPYDANTSYILYNGTSVQSTKTFTNFNQAIGTGYSIYLAQTSGSLLTSTTIIYVRPTDSSSLTGTSSSEFNSVVYLSASSIAGRTYASATLGYRYTGQDMLSNSTVYVYSTGNIQTAGLYKVATASGLSTANIIVDPVALSANATCTTTRVAYQKGMSLRSISTGGSLWNSTYTVTFSNQTCTVTTLNVYVKNPLDNTYTQETLTTELLNNINAQSRTVDIIYTYTSTSSTSIPTMTIIFS